MKVVDKSAIEARVIETLRAITSDWDLDTPTGDIAASTRLVEDLSFESIELVQLMLALEKQFGLQNLASERLLTRDGKVVPDLSVGEITAFLDNLINPS